MLFLLFNLLFADNYKTISKMEKHTCFVFKIKNIKKHHWDSDKIEYTLPFVFMDKDKTAVRIAQPSSFCTDNGLKLNQCNFYWDRTVPEENNWLDIYPNEIEKINCPFKLNKNNIKKVLN